MDALGNPGTAALRGGFGIGGGSRRPRASELRLPAILLALQVAAALGSGGHQEGAHGHLTVADWLLVGVGPLALVFRRQAPVAVLWVALAATLSPTGAWSTNLSLIVAFFLAATSGHRWAARTALLAGWVCTVGLVPLIAGRGTASADFAVLLFAWLAVLLIAAETLRIRGEGAVQARIARRLRARERAAAERLRMARELHDVIGHDISLINVQASAGLDRLDRDPEQARAALAAIKRVSHEALEELRSILAALREEDEGAPHSPAPDLARLPELAHQTEAAGITVEVETEGTHRPLPAAVELAAYRIVQEALTNVARHARARRATVRLRFETGELRIEIADDGEAAPSPPGSSTDGSGIVGMRERAAALGGELDAGPRPGGGFAVTARLPVGDNR
ncbi:MAG TPA: histidine kinase [Solirubrobacterales bacterium]|nr:histidine kinase [Solirubrobacterales bacterium]